MADMMTFPDTVEEFMEQYKMVDKEHIYSNGIEYVPIFRMKQWFEHSSDNICLFYDSTEGHCTVENTASEEATQKIAELEDRIIMLKDKMKTMQETIEYYRGTTEGLKFFIKYYGTR